MIGFLVSSAVQKQSRTVRSVTRSFRESAETPAERTMSSGIPWRSFSAATSTQPKRLKTQPILMALLARVVQSLKVVLGRVDGALV